MIDPGSVVFLAAVAALFAAAPVAFVRRRAGYTLSLAGSLLVVTAATWALAVGPFTVVSWTGVLGSDVSLRLDALSAFFVLVAGIVWTATSFYSIGYDDEPSAGLAVSYALTLGSIAILITATDWLLFLAAWEAMTLAAYWMILEALGRPSRVYSAAFVFLAFGEASTLLVAVMIAATYSTTGTFAMTAITVAGPLASVIFVAAVVGFGLKMGVAPFHMSEWLPIAHSSAPSNASAVLSSTLTLAGVYGLFRVVTLLPTGPSWWGALLLVIGAVSALLGAIFASVSEHAKGLPAYSTIENNGLILVALGIALVARAQGLPTLATFALYAALFQAFAHAVTKATLFLFAGDVERTMRTYDLTRVRGGLKDADQLASGASVVAALSLAAAPPLAGFVSEWMILESLFQSYQFGQPTLEFIGLLSGAIVALAAGLVLVAMLKFIGFTALWKPTHSAGAVPARGLAAPIAALAGVVVALGVLAPWVLVFVTPTASQLLGTTAIAPIGGLLAIPTGWSIISTTPALSMFGILSPPAISIALAVGALPAIAYYAAGRRRALRRADAWSGGRAPPRTSETYTSFGYSTGMRIMLHSILGTREIRRSAGPLGTISEIRSPETYDVELEVLDVFKSFYDVLVRLVGGTAVALQRAIMPGRVGRYLAYILSMTLIVIVYVAIAFGPR